MSARKCHGAREAAIAGALRRIELRDAAIGILDLLARRLAAASEILLQVPQDLGEVYELVDEFIKGGGNLPDCARWVEGPCARE
jgi:hypothetical protein